MTVNTLLCESPVFAGCSEQDLMSLGEFVREFEFQDKEVLFAQGDQADYLMVVSSGTVELELPLLILGETRNVGFEAKGRGEVVGWSALVPPYRFSLSARVRGRTSVVGFSRKDLTLLFDDDPALGFRVMRNLASIIGQRLHHTQQMWTCEIQRSVDARYR